jgi:hypothetical protein
MVIAQIIWSTEQKHEETSVKTEHLRLIFESCTFWIGARGSVVVKALCYKPEGPGFETRRSERIFSIYLILPAALGPGVYSVPNKNGYQKQENNVSVE